jgi:release factor glutamine methyltransferase
MCTGSGCIAIALKKYIENCDVDAIDISAKSIAKANENAMLNNVDVNFFVDDIFKCDEQFKDNNFGDNNFGDKKWADKKYDLIVSNPPYVAESEKQQMDKNVLDYEPHQALFVPDDDPLIFYKSIINFAKNNLNNNGKLFLEINQNYANEIAELMNDFNDVKIEKDFRDNYRFIESKVEIHQCDCTESSKSKINCS